MRRLLPTLVALGVGFAALSVFLVGLELVFVDERQAGQREADAFQRTLDQYATATLQRALEDDWRVGATWLETVARDPLEQSTGLFHAVQGEVLVPAVPTAGPAVVAETTRALRDPRSRSPQRRGEGSDDSPWQERLDHLSTLSRALDARDKPAIEREVRFLLEHRARWVLPPERDFPVVLTMLHWLLERATPSPKLLSVVLLDGLRGESPVEGLQRQVLRARSRLSRDDLTYLCEEVATLSHAGQVPVGEFEARCRETLGSSPLTEATALAELDRGVFVVSSPLPAPRGEGQGEGRSWYVHSTREGVLGVQVDLRASTASLEARMRQQGLLEPIDTLQLLAGAGVQAASAASVAVLAPRFARAAAQRERAFTVKTAMVFVTFLLGAGIVVVAVVAQRRKHRFVELKSRFVSTVSHELRTPLASLRLMAETLERRLDGAPAAKDYPSRIVAEVDGLAFLVENILSFNRLEKGKWTARRARFPLSRLQPVLEEDARAYAGAKVELSFSGFEREVNADADLLRLALLNLLRNACRYNARDPVTVRLEATGRGLRLTDNGVGLAHEHWETVFQEFERPAVPRGRGGGGSGLGLALCRRIARLHGGTLVIVDSSPAGTTFELTLG